MASTDWKQPKKELVSLNIGLIFSPKLKCKEKKIYKGKNSTEHLKTEGQFQKV